MIVNTREMDAPHARKPGIRGPRADPRMHGTQLQGTLDLVRKSIRSLLPIGRPPLRRFGNRPGRAADNVDRPRLAHVPRIFRRTSAAPTVSPRSASAMAARRAA